MTTQRIALTDAERLYAALVGVDPNTLNDRIQKLGPLIQLKWQEEADTTSMMRTTRAQYRDSIRIIDSEPNSVAVALTDPLANMLEQGAPPFDMRQTLLHPQGDKANKVKRSKAGYAYRIIPFRHQVPSSQGLFGKTMPEGIYQQAQHLRATLSQADAEAAIARLQDPVVAAHHTQRLQASSRGTLWGGVSDFSPNKAGSLPAGVGGIGPLRPWHATDPYAGMYRMGKQYAKANQSTYMTFRVISDNPETYRDHEGKTVEAGAANWQHPGFAPPMDLAAKVRQWVEDVAIPQVFGAGADSQP